MSTNHSSPVTADPEYPDAPMVCAELYQVIGYMAFHYGIMEHPDVQKALDNASQHKLVHADLLPWPKQDLPPSAPAQCAVWPTGTGNTPQDVQLTSLVTRPDGKTP